MIFRVNIGDVAVLLDDELDERPTPEHCRDYLKACTDEAARLYDLLPTTEASDQG